MELSVESSLGGWVTGWLVCGIGCWGVGSRATGYVSGLLGSMCIDKVVVLQSTVSLILV